MCPYFTRIHDRPSPVDLAGHFMKSGVSTDPYMPPKRCRGAESETIGFPENGYSLRCREVPECQITNYNLMFCFFLNLFHKIYKYLVWGVERDGAGRSSKSILYYARK